MKFSLGGQHLRTVVTLSFIALLTLYVYVEYYFIPTSRNASQLQEQIRDASERLKSLQAATANQEALQAQYRQVEQTVSSMRTALPNESELPAVLEVLSNLAANANVKIQSIYPQRTVTTSSTSASGEPAVYREIPVQVDALAGYHALGTFLNQVEVGDKPMQVMSLRITSNPKEPRRHQVNLLLRAYFAVSEEFKKNAG